jgi:hypothetical protein
VLFCVTGVQIPEEEQDVPQQQQQQQQQVQQSAADSRSNQQQLDNPKQQQQQQQQLSKQAASRAARVAASNKRRSALLARLAAARVAARAKIVRLPLRLSIAGRAGSRRYLTVPVDVEGVGFVDFLLDGSSYLSRITPGLRSRLGMGPADGVAVVMGRNKPQNPSSSSSSSGAGSSSEGEGSSSSSSSSGGTAAASSKLRLRQRVQLPDMWLGESAPAVRNLMFRVVCLRVYQWRRLRVLPAADEHQCVTSSFVAWSATHDKCTVYSLSRARLA